MTVVVIWMAAMAALVAVLLRHVQMHRVGREESLLLAMLGVAALCIAAALVAMEVAR